MTRDIATVQQRLDALLDLTTALIGAGRNTGGAFDLAHTCARAVDLPELELFDQGSVVCAQCTLTFPEGTRTVVRSAKVASFGGINCADLKRLDEVTNGVTSGRISASELPQALADVRAHPPASALWTVGGMTILSFCIALQVGLGPLASLVAALAQIVTSLSGRVIARWDVPRFFSAFAQTVVCAVVVVVIHALGMISWQEAAACVAVPWMLIIPLPALVTSVLDAAFENGPAALGRAFVVVLTSGGVVLGGILVLRLGSHLDLQAPGDGLVLPTLPIPLVLMFCALGAMANAMANGGERDLLLPGAAIGVFTAAVNQTLMHLVGLPASYSSVLTAVVLGLVAGVWARYVPYPASVMALLGIMGALLPGLTVYLGIANELFHDQGWQDFVAAAFTGVGLGVGVAAGLLVVHLATRRQRVATHDAA